MSGEGFSGEPDNGGLVEIGRGVGEGVVGLVPDASGEKDFVTCGCEFDAGAGAEAGSG